MTPACREQSIGADGVFEFLGISGVLSEIGWTGPKREKLWRYNQHYFDDLNALNARSRKHLHESLMQAWVSQNPPAHGEAWESYPTSLRIVNWIKWALSGNVFPEACLQSLAVQVRWLTDRLEFHLLGNHLFSNAKALVFAGLYFSGEEANHWRDTGLKILSDQVSEQILTDGGQFERSTMYQALAFEDMLDLCNVAACYSDRLGAAGLKQLGNWRRCVTEMWRWMLVMSHPDGGLAFFNDAAFGVAPTLQELEAYAERLGFKRPSVDLRAMVTSLNESGYLRLQSDRMTMLLDVAPIGPDYLPGHAHADTLSFELSVAMRRVFVNSGTSCYGVSAERLRQRGTSAHNTVTVNGLDSSEVWSGFRVARRARPISLSIECRADGVQVVCAHDGYMRVSGRPIHKRSWSLADDVLVVEDLVTGACKKAEARFHIHPDVSLLIDSDNQSGRLTLQGGQVLIWGVEKGKARVEQSTYHPRFGVQIPNLCLVISVTADQRSRLRLSMATE